MLFKYEKTGTWLRSVVLFAGSILLVCCTAFASTQVNLDGFWRFKTDPSGEGKSMGWAQKMPAGTESVRVPGTWNVIREYHNFVGEAWYFKTFTFPEFSHDQRAELHFGATFYKSHVWLNGTELGGHEGGYTAYFFDLTPYLKPVNYLAVEIDNRPSMETIPGWAGRDSPKPGHWYDWWPQGGIIRDVWLKVSAPQLVRWQQIRSSVSGTEATVTDHVHLQNYSSGAGPGRLTLKVLAPDGSLAASSTRRLTLAPGSTVATVKLRLDAVKLWSFDNPNLYRMETVLTDPRGNVLDSRAENFGVRTIEIRNRQLYLNGKVVRLTGIDRHEDSPWEGVAETEGTILHDFDDLKNLQVTLSRPVHYPQNPRIYDFCDRHGILLIPEIPLWHFDASQLADPKVIALARQMMREVIEQDGNHPSIFAWSVCNESATDTPRGVAYFKTMYEFIKSLDPERYVTYADDLLPQVENPRDNAASYADFVMWNEYYGSGHGPESLLPGLIRKIGKDYPDKMIIISETAPWTALTTDLEQAQQFRDTSIHKELALFGKYSWIAGVLYWSYAPYRSHAHVLRTKLTVSVPATRGGSGSFAFMDQNRQRNPLYYAFQKYNSPADIELQLLWPKAETAAFPPSGFTATIRRHGSDQIPSYSLDHYQAVWRVVDASGTEVEAGQQALPVIGPLFTLEKKWNPPAKAMELTVHLWLYRPTGFLAAQRTCRWMPGIWKRGLWRCRNIQ
jgi:beta-glucuronidase